MRMLRGGGTVGYDGNDGNEKGGYSSARVRKKRRTRSRTLTGGGSL